MITLTLLIVVISLITFLVHSIKGINRQWIKRGIKQKRPVLFFGNMLNVITGKQHITDIYEEIYKQFPDEPLVGFYDFIKPIILVQDADYIEKILIKDFVNFIDHGFGINEEKNPIDAQLFSMVGKRWRAFRYKLSPIFTSGKLKGMFESMIASGDDLTKHLRKINKNELNLYDIMGKFTIDALGSSVFGIHPKALENPNSKFCKLASEVFISSGVYGSLNFFFMNGFPILSQKLGLSFNNPKAVDYFCKILNDTFESRKKHNIKRNDFIQLLLNLKEKGKIEVYNWDPNDDYLKNNELSGDDDSNVYEITDNVLMAQAYSFLANGLDGMAVTKANTFFELSQNPEIQKKARNEILEQIELHNGLTHTALKNMTYLENIIKETLRVHPVGAHIFRVSKKDYTFPNGFTMKKDELLRIPVNVVHKNPNYFPDPDVFKPERFEIQPKPGTYLPFGEGPRVCIAMRYALLLIKYGVAKVLANYEIQLSPKTKLPIVLNPRSIINVPSQPLLYNLEEFS